MFEKLKTQSDSFAYKLRTRRKAVPFCIAAVNAICGLIFWPFCRLAMRKSVPGVPTRLLIIRVDRIGDMILSTPIFKSLKELYPKATITCMASSLSAPLLAGNPHVDEVVVYDPPWFDRDRNKNYFHSYVNVFRYLRGARFDMAIDLRGNYANILFLMFLPGIRHRVSFDAAMGSFLLTKEVPFEPGKHETAYFMDIVKSLGGQTSKNPFPVYVVSSEEKEYADRFFRRHGLDKKDVIIAMHPGTGVKRIFKRWPKERYCELGKKLARRSNVKIIITGAKAEVDLAASIREEIGQSAVLCAGEVRQLRHLAAILQRCTVCVGSSTGIIHLASAVGVPVVVLSGPEDTDRWRPLGDKYTLVKKEVRCRPCREESCPYDGRCLRDITAEEVVAALEDYI